MALAKELQAEGNCGEQVILDDPCENDSQPETITAPINATFPQGEDDKILSPGAVRVRTYSIDSGELDVRGISSQASCSIKSVNSNPSLGGGVPSNIGEADTVDETVSEMLSNRKEASKQFEDESSIDTNEDGNFAAKAVEIVDQKREQRKKRIEEMDKNKKRGKSLKKRKGEEVKLNKIGLATVDIDGEDAIAAIEDLLATVYNEKDVDPSKYATPTIPVEITTTKKSKKKKKSKKSSKRKDRKQKGDKGNASDSTGGSWWKLRALEEDAYESSITGARKRNNAKASYDWGADSLRSTGSKDSGNGSYSTSRIRKGRGTTSSLQSDSYYIPGDASYSLRSIVEDEDCEDIKGSAHVGNTHAVESVNTTTNANGESNEEKKYSGYGGAMSLNDMIAEAAAKRQERLASKQAARLPFQSPAVKRESLSSKLQNTPSFPAPLSPQTVEDDDESISMLELVASTNDEDKINEKSKNSGNGSGMTMNEMIAEAVAKREERLASKSPKLPFQSPCGHKESLSSRFGTKGFASPLPLEESEHDATSAVGAVDYSSSTNITGVGVEDKNHDNVNTIDISADEPLTENDGASEINTKPKTFKKFEPIALTEEQRKEHKDNHRKLFLPVVGEAATYGRLVRLEEQVVESQGGANPHRVDNFSTWSGPKMRTDDRRSSALKAIQEAAAMGRMKSLIPEIVTNHDETDGDEKSEDHFDIENQIDEYGDKICRTNFLLDRHVKESLQGKKERMFACSDAKGARDDRIASYKDFDDVKLPTEILPTFNRVLGRRANMKKFSSAADLALISMQMSEGNLEFNANNDDDDSPEITLKKLRVIERISSAVADSAWKRESRLQQPRAVLKVTRKCMCPYCKDPNPYQTHKYKRLMYPERFNDNADQNNYCQEVGETIGTLSDAVKADKSSYAISPGGRKKKVIRIVRRKKRRPKGLLPQSSEISSDEKNRVIGGTSLTTEQLDILTKQLQTQGANGMTTEELVLIANALRDKVSTTVDATPVKEEPDDVKNQISSSSGQQESVTDLSTGKLLQEATGVNATGTTIEEMPQLGNKLLVSLHLDEEPTSVDPVPHHALEKANDVPTSDSMMGSNSIAEGDQEKDLGLPTSLPFIDITGDCSSTPTASTQDITLDTATKQLPAVSPTRKKSKSVSTNRKSSQSPKKTKRSLPKSPSLRKPVLPKSPSLRKPRKMLSAPPELSNAKKVPPGAHISSTKYHSPKGDKKKKVARRRLKEATQSPIQNDFSNLPAPPSKIGEAPRKKTLRSRLKNLTGQTSSDGSRGDKDNKSKSDRRSKRRSHSLHARPDSLPASSDGKDKERTSRSDRVGRRSHSLTPRHEAVPAANNGSEENKGKVPSSDSCSDRLVKDLMEKPPKSTSNSHSELKERKWAPLRRAPTRTQSLPIAQEEKTAQAVGQRSNKPQKVRSLPQQNALPQIPTLGDEAIRKPPSRTRSLQGPPKGEQKVSEKSFEPKICFKKKDNKPVPPIPSFITISLDTEDNCVDSNSNSTEPTAHETPENSESSHPVQKQRIKKPRKTKSLDRQRVKPRKCRSLDAHRISENTRRRSRSKPRKGKKADITEPEKVYRGTQGNEFHPSALNGNESRPKLSNQNRQGPLTAPRRGRSLDRVTIKRLSDRGKGVRKDTSLDRLKKNLTPRKWFKKGIDNPARGK